MSNDLWNKFENFWNKEEVKEKAERYQELYKNPEIEDEEFSWINDNDRDDLKRKKSKAIRWGIPNHILGDIDNAKFIVGLLNPRTHMKTKDSNDCETVGEYIQEEFAIEKKYVNDKNNTDFASKEIFETMEEAEALGYDVEEKFEKALYNIKVANIELIPYRTFGKGDLKNLKNLESSRLSVNTIIDKIKRDKDTVVFLRSYSFEDDKYDSWENLFINICNERNIDYERDIKPSIYKFKGQSAAISKNNIVSTLSSPENNENVKSVSDVIDELHEEISLNKFKEELEELTKNND
ncbi:hypothetical protein [Staphylococcus caledonicus]|uniref:hypothetical protein n=1 Tax=Staphylococcus caledonicus TaxID=2741333 RepID=UPI0018E42412|nr:hypothetical protein [Staphylococcus caledonicus]MBI5973644.1 hypothetical protein [Staphylococcus caledonicus]